MVMVEVWGADNPLVLVVRSSFAGRFRRGRRCGCRSAGSMLRSPMVRWPLPLAGFHSAGGMKSPGQSTQSITRNNRVTIGEIRS
jgi:hypothetical protein